MKNFKKLAFGLLVMGLAFTGSAFTNAYPVEAGDVYVQTDTDEYTKISFSEYLSSNCQNSTPRQCAFRQSTSDNVDHGDTLTSAQIAAITTITALGSDRGIYLL